MLCIRHSNWRSRMPINTPDAFRGIDRLYGDHAYQRLSTKCVYVVGIGGVAIGPRYDFVNGEILSEGNKLTTISKYDEGGFCQYKLSEIYLYFLNNKNAY